MTVKCNFPRKADQEADCHFILLSELPQELPVQGLQSLHRSHPPQHSSWRISWHEHAVRNQAAEQEISQLCDSAGVALSVVEQIILACIVLGSWKESKHGTFSQLPGLKKGVFDLPAALSAPVSGRTIRTPCLCLLFVFHIWKLQTCCLECLCMSWCCAVDVYSLGTL